MSHKLLKSDGSIVDLAADDLNGVVVIDATDPALALTLLQSLKASDTALLNMPSSADGRALSITGFFAASVATTGPTLWIGGDLLPDQVTLALQCGADAVVVSDSNWTSRGKAGWTNALKPPVTQLYRSEVWPAVADISSARRQTQS